MELTEKEMRCLVDRMRQLRAGLPVTDHEALVLWSWAQRVRSESLMLEMMLDGDILPDVNEEGNVCLYAPGGERPKR